MFTLAGPMVAFIESVIAFTEPVVALLKSVVALVVSVVCGLWSQFTTGLHMWHNYVVFGCDF